MASPCSPKEAEAIAQEAIVFFHPMIENYKSMFETAVDASSPKYRAPFNVFAHRRSLLTPKFKTIVMPNNDTLYSDLWLDLRTEPVVLSLPQVPETRYYSIQLNDAYTHNFAILGSRTTGNGPGLYMVAGPNWNGSPPNGVSKCYESESEFVKVFVRVQVNGVEDIPAVEEIQNQFVLTPLSAFLGQQAPSPSPLPQFLRPDEEKLKSLDYFQYVNFIMQFVKIHPFERDLFDKFSRIGIIPGAIFSPAESLVESVKKAIELEDIILLKVYVSVKRIEQNGWTVSFQPPLFGSREVMQGRYSSRAVAATFGLYGLDPEEAHYYQCNEDSDKKSLDGSKKRYTLTFPKDGTPTVKGVWSLTLYNKERFLFDNVINRYAIGQHTQGLKIATDGSLTVNVQSDPPTDPCNWLPAPKGSFHLLLRLYWPVREAGKELYIPPALVGLITV